MLHFIHPFMIRHIASNFPSVPIVLHQFFTCIALGDIDLHFSLIIKKSQCCWRGN